MPRNPTATRALGAEVLAVGATRTWAREAESEVELWAANDTAVVTGVAAVAAAEEAEAVAEMARAVLTAVAEYLRAHRG
ncbi:unnamed protein product, partial [Ectocarpus sp. 12 AP-2014]